MFINEPFLIKGFKRLVQGDNLAQSYLFFGFTRLSFNVENSKLRFAQCLANFLESKEWSESNRLLLDAIFINPEDYRLIRNFLWQKPVLSSRRTVVIKNAHQFSVLAQNAILKIVEEPPAKSLIILLVNDPNSLLPTLASRFQKIYFGKDNANDVHIIADEDRQSYIRNFLEASRAKQKEILKEVVEDDEKMEEFVASLINELSRDKIKNWRILKELLYRWSLINRYNVNKRLQLEAILLRN